MKLLACGILLALMAGVGGCTLDTPAMSADQRFAQIQRNMDFESEMLNDDFDSVMLLRPSNQLTVWQIFNRD